MVVAAAALTRQPGPEHDLPPVVGPYGRVVGLGGIEADVRGPEVAVIGDDARDGTRIVGVPQVVGDVVLLLRERGHGRVLRAGWSGRRVDAVPEGGRRQPRQRQQATPRSACAVGVAEEITGGA